MSRVPEPSQSAADKPPRERLAEGQEVSLGCGTLILIALIVLIFGRGGTSDLEREVKGLRSEVGELKKAVEAQTSQIKALQDKLDKTKGKE
jgi:Sec-independent protein translocase protein TatA